MALPTKVQDPAWIETASGTSLARAFASNVTAGNTIVVMVMWSAITGTVSSLVDTLGNTYTLKSNAGALYQNRHTAAIYIATNIVGGANTVTLTMSAAQAASMKLYEFSGTCNVLGEINEQDNVANAASGSASAGSITTNSQNDIVLTCCFQTTTTPTGAASGYTLSAATTNHAAAAYKIETNTVSAESMAFTGGAGAYCALFMVLRPAIYLRQYCTDPTHGGSTTPSCLFGSGTAFPFPANGFNNLVGATIFAFITWDTAATISSVTDDQSNTYTQIGTTKYNGSTNAVALFVARNISNAGGGKITVTAHLSSAPTGPEVCVFEFGGLGTTAPNDKFVSNSGSGTTIDIGTSGTLAQTDEVLLQMACVSGSGATAGTAGWYFLQTNTNHDGFQYKIVSSTAAQDPTFTIVSATWAGIYATFYAASGASISPSGIASVTAFGTAVVAPGAVSITPSGIASVTAFGTAALASTYSLAPSGIASTNAFGTAVLLSTATVSPAGIASVNAFGTAVVSPGAVSISPSGIASVTAFGTAVVNRGTVNLAPSGIASVTAFGTATVAPGSVSITPGGIASVTAFGTASVSLAGAPQSVTPSGIASVTAFGTATLLSTFVISPAGIASTNAFGAATVSGAGSPQGITATGIASTNAFGTAVISQGAVVNIAVSGIPSTLVFGQTSVSIGVGVNFILPAGIGNVNAFGRSVVLFWPNPVPPYAGQEQPAEMVVPRPIQFKEAEPEEGPWAMVPYAWIYPKAPEPVIEERGYDQVHHEWLKTHPRPKGPRRMGDTDHRPQSVLPKHKPKRPIKR